MKSFRRFLLASAAISTFQSYIVTSPASAQEHENAPLVLDVVIVDASKRNEVEIRMPVATTILSPEQVRPETLDPIAEIARQVPGTNFVDFARFGESYITMRGVATLGSASNALDNTVGLSVDSVPTSLTAINAPMIDVQRIEVLRGPQGTTFGRNALGGVINIVSTPADGTREIRLDSAIGNDGYGFVQSTLGGWIIPDTVAGRGVLRFEKYDGDIPNVVIGGHDGGVRVSAGKGSLRFTPDDTLTIDVTGQYTHHRRNDPSNILLEADNFPISGADYRPWSEQDIGSGSLKITKEFESYTITSITAYQDIRTKSDADFTDALLYSSLYGLPQNSFNNPDTDWVVSKEREKIFNQEVRISSAEGSSWRWVAGASYFRSKYNLNRDMETIFWPTMNGTFDNDITSETFAVFADAGVPIGDSWEISGGLRIAHDRQKLNGRYTSNGFPGTVPYFNQNGKYSDTYVTGRMALSYQWAENIMTYASIARGYSSGGFGKAATLAPLGIPSAGFAPTEGLTYEIGSKAQLTDYIRLDAALFYNDMKNGQLSGFDSATRTVFFANQDYKSYGFEANVIATLFDGFDINGGLSLIQSKLVNVADPAPSAGVEDGNKVPMIPNFAATFGINYTLDLENYNLKGLLLTSVNYQYVGSRYSDIANTGKTDAYSLVNTRIGWKKDNLTLYGFVNNVFDERPIYWAGYNKRGSAAYTGRGRVFGIGMSSEW